jgi:hypothetical protein
MITITIVVRALLGPDSVLFFGWAIQEPQNLGAISAHPSP